MSTKRQGQLKRAALFQRIDTLLRETNRDLIRSKLEQICHLLRKYSEKYTGVYIYVVHGDDLILHAFSGRKTVHKVIPTSKGICGLAVRQRGTVNVPDVTQNKEYIACSMRTLSELVVPIFNDGKVVAEIDIDSDFKNAFNSADEKLIREVGSRLSRSLPSLLSRGNSKGRLVSKIE
jgi:L-methionine (R)-S-oxide reductase